MACSRFLFLFLLFSISFFSCKKQLKEQVEEQNECDCPRLRYLGIITSIDTLSASHLYETILLQNKSIIPCLIDSIDILEEGFVGFQNPISSTLHAFTIGNQRGINYAYLIEFILSRDTIESVKHTWGADQNLSHWDETIKPYRIYEYGVIVKKDSNGNPMSDALTHDDMIVIKSFYSEWWRANKNKPFEVLREERKKGARILKDPYIWI